MTKRATILSALLVLGALALPADAVLAEDGVIPITVNLADAGWKHRKFFGKAEAEFEAGVDGIVVKTDKSTSILHRNLGSQAKDRPVLSWRWRVDQAPPPTDLSQKGGDDRALMLHLWFPAPDDEDALFSMSDVSVQGHSITYVWGGDHDPGTVLPNPFFGNGVLIVLEGPQAPLETWRDVTVNWADDFQNAFGREAPPPERLGLSGDSDDTDTQSLGVFADIQFKEP